MSEIKLRVKEADLKRIKRTLNGLSPTASGKIMVDGMRRVGVLLDGKVKEGIASKGKFFKHPTGALARSFNSRVQSSASSLMVVVGSGVGKGQRLPYANIQETGGTIRPKNGKYLMVPIMSYGGSSGAYGKADSYRLVTQVKIPGTGYMSKTLAENTEGAVRELIAVIQKESFKI